MLACFLQVSSQLQDSNAANAQLKNVNEQLVAENNKLRAEMEQMTEEQLRDNAPWSALHNNQDLEEEVVAAQGAQVQNLNAIMIRVYPLDFGLFQHT